MVQRGSFPEFHVCNLGTSVVPNVIRDARIRARDAIENGIEGNLGAFRIAAFTRFNQPLGFVRGRGVDEDHALLFRYGVEESR